MALFKSRRGGEEPVAPTPSPTESIETMRRRARHRLIGAVVLVLSGVIGFPLLFDTQPRPVAVDIPIEIPDRNKVKPLPPLPQAHVATGKVAAAPEAGNAAASATPAAAEAPPRTEAKVAVVAPPPPKAAVTTERAEAKPEPKVARAETEPKAKAETRPEPKPEPRPAVPADDGAKARALLEGGTVESASPVTAEAAGGRFIVQVGAFADPVKAREVRLALERAGLKTYTHVAETKEGKRIRVRTGPYMSRPEADRAAEKIKGLDLPAAILTL